MSTTQKQTLPINEKEFEKLAKETYELNELVKELSKQLEESKARLKEQGSARYGEYIVLVEQRHRESFDLKAARKDWPEEIKELLESKVKLSSYRQLKIERAFQ